MVVVKVDVDELGDLAHKQGIAAMPTFLFFKCRDFDECLIVRGDLTS